MPAYNNSKKIQAGESIMKNSGILHKLSIELYLRRNANKKIIKVKKSWDEINKAFSKK